MSLENRIAFIQWNESNHLSFTMYAITVCPYCFCIFSQNTFEFSLWFVPAKCAHNLYHSHNFYGIRQTYYTVLINIETHFSPLPTVQLNMLLNLRLIDWFVSVGRLVSVSQFNALPKKLMKNFRFIACPHALHTHTHTHTRMYLFSVCPNLFFENIDNGAAI